MEQDEKKNVEIPQTAEFGGEDSVSDWRTNLREMSASTVDYPFSRPLPRVLSDRRCASSRRVRHGPASDKRDLSRLRAPETGGSPRRSSILPSAPMTSNPHLAR
eukprot:6182437-Pleurochrysis_carterae.AAC.3